MLPLDRVDDLIVMFNRMEAVSKAHAALYSGRSFNELGRLHLHAIQQELRRRVEELAASIAAELPKRPH